MPVIPWRLVSRPINAYWIGYVFLTCACRSICNAATGCLKVAQLKFKAYPLSKKAHPAPTMLSDSAEPTITLCTKFDGFCASFRDLTHFRKPTFRRPKPIWTNRSAVVSLKWPRIYQQLHKPSQRKASAAKNFILRAPVGIRSFVCYCVLIA